MQNRANIQNHRFLCSWNNFLFYICAMTTLEDELKELLSNVYEELAVDKDFKSIKWKFATFAKTGNRTENLKKLYDALDHQADLNRHGARFLHYQLVLQQNSISPFWKIIVSTCFFELFLYNPRQERLRWLNKSNKVINMISFSYFSIILFIFKKTWFLKTPGFCKP